MGTTDHFVPHRGSLPLCPWAVRELLAVHRIGLDVDEGPPCRGKDLLALFQLPTWGKLVSTAPDLDTYSLRSETPPAQLV